MMRGRRELTMKVILMFSMALMLAEAKTDPGVIGRLTLKGLQYGWKVALQELQQQTSSIHIPDVEGSVSVAVLGRIQYHVSGLQIRSIDLSQSGLAFCPNTGVNVSIQQGQIEIAGDIWIRTVLFSASARMTLWVQGLSVAGSLGVTCDDFGHAAVWDAGCLANVGRVDMSFSGGSGWIFGMFKGSMIGPIRSAISDKICPSFRQAVIEMEKKLSNLPVTLRVDQVSDLEVNLVGPPFVTDQRCDVFVKAEFVAHSQYESPYHPERMLLPDVDSRMVLLALSQFSANSAWFAHYKAGYLKYNVTDDMIPKLSPLRLNIRSLGVFAPELPARFPDSPPLLLQTSARSAPTVTCKLDSLSVQASADIELFALYPNRLPTALFKLQADSLTDVSLVLSEESLGATISVRNFSLSLAHSDVGEVKVDTMQKTLNTALKLLLPVVNARLRGLYPLAPIGVGLRNPTFRVMKGYIVIMTDLQITRSSLQHGHDLSNPRDGESVLL